MEKKFETLLKIKYGSLDPKVNLEPDFFTGFDPARRKEIVTEEAAFYHGITQPYSKDDKLEKHYESFIAEDGYEIPVKECNRIITGSDVFPWWRIYDMQCGNP